MFIRDGATNHLMEHPIFQHDLFKQYSIDLLMAMDRNGKTRLNQEENANLSQISQTLEDLKIDQVSSMASMQQENRMAQQGLQTSLCRMVQTCFQQEFKGLTKDLITTIIPTVLEVINQEIQRQRQSSDDVHFAEYVLRATQTAVKEYQAQRGAPGRIQGRTSSDTSTSTAIPVRLLALDMASRRLSPASPASSVLAASSTSPMQQ